MYIRPENLASKYNQQFKVPNCRLVQRGTDCLVQLALCQKTYAECELLYMQTYGMYLVFDTHAQSKRKKRGGVSGVKTVKPGQYARITGNLLQPGFNRKKKQSAKAGRGGFAAMRCFRGGGGGGISVQLKVLRAERLILYMKCSIIQGDIGCSSLKNFL